jgi:hypothetical protein
LFPPCSSCGTGRKFSCATLHVEREKHSVLPLVFREFTNLTAIFT